MSEDGDGVDGGDAVDGGDDVDDREGDATDGGDGQAADDRDDQAADDVDGTQTLSVATCRRMLREIDATWDLRDVTAADTGFNDVYFVTVGTDDGPRELVCKVSDGTAEQVRAEARLTRLLRDDSAIPVPAVLGRVDAHPDLPAPFFLMDRLAGEHPDGPPSEIPAAELETLARQVGHHLGELHALDAFDAFGWIRAEGDADPEASGGVRPRAAEHGLTVAGATDDWPAHLRNLAGMHLRHHADTRFGDRTVEIREAVEDGIDRLDALDGSYSPVVGRIDHGFENYLVESGTRRVTGVLDWGMLRTVDPAYDLSWAEAAFAGLLPLEADRRRRLRTAIHEGYETHASVDGTQRQRRLYHLINAVARQNWVSDWVTPRNADEVERKHRALLDDLLAE